MAGSFSPCIYLRVRNPLPNESMRSEVLVLLKQPLALEYEDTP